MKPQQFLPFLAAAIGFAVAWVVKPTATAPAPTGSEVGKTPGKSVPKNESPRTRPSAVSEKRPKEVKAGDFPLADLADKGPKTRTESKMLRLSEALGLSIDQQGEIIKALEDAKAAASDKVPVIQDLTTRGKVLEETLKGIFTPEQLAKFEELRVRERENRIEARAQRMLSPAIEEIDLSPGQRDDVLARLRQLEKEKVQSIPAAATLLLNTSMLPTDASDPTVDAVLVLTKIEEGPASPTDPMAAHEKVIRGQRQELEEQLECFDGILTPAQMGQIHAAIAEKRATLDKLQQPPPQANPPAVPGDSPETE